MTITSSILERLQLLRNGYSKGISVNWLSKSNNEIFDSLESFLDSKQTLSKFFNKKTISSGMKVFQKSTNDSIRLTSQNWNSQKNLCALIYSFIINNNVQLVIETGVANGISTNVILQALKKTGGTLHSFDILPITKDAVLDSSNWHFHLLTEKRAKSELLQLVNKIGKCDLWLHDSNHGFDWQSFEFRLAFNNLKKNGFLFSDDIDSSPAWGYFSNSRKKTSVAIFDNRKFVGFHKKD